LAPEAVPLPARHWREFRLGLDCGPPFLERVAAPRSLLRGTFAHPTPGEYPPRANGGHAGALGLECLDGIVGQHRRSLKPDLSASARHRTVLALRSMSDHRSWRTDASRGRRPASKARAVTGGARCVWRPCRVRAT